MSVGGQSRNAIHNQIRIVIIGLIIGTFSILAASSFRDAFDAVLQVATPIGERSLSGGGMLVAYRTCYFLIILAILIAATICFI